MTDGDLGDGLHRTFEPTITEWLHGDTRERIVIPSGETTDYSSIPSKGILGALAKMRGFDYKAPYFIKPGKIHDPLYEAIKLTHGIMPVGWYQFFNPITNRWENAVNYQWARKAADIVWRRVAIEEGCPPKIANEGYLWLRAFGGLHNLLT